jgi:hypothetical protein
MEGTWSVLAVDGADVRLRSGRIGLVTVDVTAPVTSGSLRVDRSGIVLDLAIGLDRLRTSNFLLQAAARTLVTRHGAHVLSYAGRGGPGDAWRVSGDATAGDVRVTLDLDIRWIDDARGPHAIELVGSANVGRVHLPLPGLGTVEDFAFDVDASLSLTPAQG